MFGLSSLPGDIELYRAASEALGVQNLDYSRVRDVRGLEADAMCVLKSWYAEIRPPAAPPACIAHIQTASAKDRAVLRGARTVLCVLDTQAVVVQGPVYREPGWNDPVAATLTNLDLWPGEGEIPFGGFNYRLLISTTHLRAVIKFGRMVHPSRKAIASAMLEVASSFGSDEHPIVSAFLGLWCCELRSFGS